MKLEVYDDQFNRLGLINAYSFIQYTDKFSDIGSFQLNCPLIDRNVELLFGSKDRILWIENTVAGIIQYGERSTEDDEDNIIVKGSLLSVMLNWRYIYPQFYMKAYPDVVLRELVRAHLVTPTGRLIPNFTIEEHTSPFTTQTVYQQTGSYVGTECTSIAEAYEIGFAVKFLPALSQFLFAIRYGVDRTIGNAAGNNPVIFSRELNNILQSSYVNNRESYKNMAIIAGEGEGTARTTALIGNTITGYNRRELFVDAKDLSSTTDDSTTLTTEEYQTLLIQRGTEKLQDCVEIESFESVVRNDAEAKFVYNRDYYLGDKVTVVDKKLLITTSAIVTAVTITYDENGYTVEPVFGYGLPTIMQKLKRKGVF
jgi:hypothetical protein